MKGIIKIIIRKKKIVLATCKFVQIEIKFKERIVVRLR